jgi:hypothetical protein
MNFILWVDGAEHGPYDSESLQNSIQAGEISPKVLARLDTGKDWKPLESFLPKPKPESSSQVPLLAKSKALKTAAIIIASLLCLGAVIVGVRHAAAVNKVEAENEKKAAGNAVAAEAVAELKKIESAVEAGINFPEYSRRVLDAKVSVDAILERLPEDHPIHEQLAKTMRAYIAARNLWGLIIRKGGTDGGVYLKEDDRQDYEDYGDAFAQDGYFVISHVRIIWAYASAWLTVMDAIVKPSARATGLRDGTPAHPSFGNLSRESTRASKAEYPLCRGRYSAKAVHS